MENKTATQILKEDIHFKALKLANSINDNKVIINIINTIILVSAMIGCFCNVIYGAEYVFLGLACIVMVIVEICFTNSILGGLAKLIVMVTNISYMSKETSYENVEDAYIKLQEQAFEECKESRKEQIYGQ